MKKNAYDHRIIKVKWDGPAHPTDGYEPSAKFLPRERSGVTDDGKKLEVKRIPGGAGGCSKIFIDGKEFYSIYSAYAPDVVAKYPQAVTFQLVEAE